ncbi:hypothetical protein AB0O64_29160 [Streptomyces sp. NPDC088341]|uniref:hypothetical protein n=1 Tax=Streptomyces sp. NPDC088341 TaxID=3154870 RepID=UPI003446C95D
MPVALARAAVFTVTGVVLAVTGHHVVSGDPVPWRAVPPAAAALFLLALPALSTTRPRRQPSPRSRSRSWPLSLPAVIAATGAAQLALHLWLARNAAHRTPGPQGTPGAHAVGHGTVGHGAAHGTHEAWHAGRHGLAMTAAHILAALLVAWCLQRADAACLAVGERLGGVLGDLFVRLVRRVPPRLFPSAPRVLRAVGTRAQPPPRDCLVLAHAVVRRGPPAEPAPAL